MQALLPASAVTSHWPLVWLCCMFVRFARPDFARGQTKPTKPFTYCRRSGLFATWYDSRNCSPATDGLVRMLDGRFVDYLPAHIGVVGGGRRSSSA